MTSPTKRQDSSLPHSAREREVARARSCPRPCQHTHSQRHTCKHRVSLSPLSQDWRGGGGLYQVISSKIDDDSIIVQILSNAWPDPPSKTPSHRPLEGHPACSLCPRWCLHGGTKRLHKHRSYFCQPLLPCHRDRKPQRDGNGPSRADRLRGCWLR